MKNYGSIIANISYDIFFYLFIGYINVCFMYLFVVEKNFIFLIMQLFFDSILYLFFTDLNAEY